MSGASKMERRINAWLCAEITSKPEHARAGCFVAGFDLASAHPFLNYAVPVEDAEPGFNDVAALERVFRERWRMPRLEYIEAAAPWVEPALRDAGFSVEERLAVMAWQPGRSIAPHPDAFVVELASGDRELAEAAQVQSGAFGNGEADPSRLCRLVTNGGLVAVARDGESGPIAGAGTARVAHDGVTEIAGIGVLSRFRRQGIATALTARLARESHSRGVSLVWLTPGDQSAETVYARAGFVRVSEQLHMSKPGAA
ncbi:MAG TPA: GNAT family N-acetyltransferase [Rhizomicrobium sp.]|jgi:ribosomal protein S18 acetylase RimI-like enzyme